MPTYVARVIDGLEQLAADDLRERLRRARLLDTITGIEGDSALILVRHNAPPAELPPLPLLEDLGLLIADVRGVPGGWSGLQTVRNALVAARGWDEAIALIATVLPGHTLRTTFHVSAWPTGSHAFLRSDLQRAIAQGVNERFPGWKLVPRDAHFELFADLVGERLIIALRLPRRDAEKLLKTTPAGTPRPSVAAALVRLSQPAPGDIFLDPLCGAGVVLIARGMWGRYRWLLGGDPGERMIAAAQANIGPRFKPRTLFLWRPEALPLAPASVSCIVTALRPGGEGSAGESKRAWHAALIAEWQRVLMPGGRLVVLGYDRRALDAAFARRPALQIEQRIVIAPRGKAATIVVARLRGGRERAAASTQRREPASPRGQDRAVSADTAP